jgi:antitoxin HigA-1
MNHIEPIQQPLHPGYILKTEFLEPMGLTPYALAKACFIPRSRIERIVREQLGISGDTALRLAKAFDMSAQFWVNLQAHYTLRIAEYQANPSLEKIKPVKQAA